MTPANILTPEQQEILKQAMRANNRLERIWSLYATCVAHDSNQDLEKVLERAERAVDVWMEFDDATRIDTTKIATETGAFLQNMMEQIKKIGNKPKRQRPACRRERMDGAES